MPTRERIIDAAEKLMREKGYAHATTKEIAKAADCSEATLYKHFEDRTDIFLAVLTLRLPDLGFHLDNLIAKAGSGTVRANLMLVADSALRFYLESFPIAMSLFSSRALLDAHRAKLKLREMTPRYPNNQLAEYLGAEQSQGRLRRTFDPDAAASLLLGACFQTAFFATFDDQPPDDAVIEHLAGQLVKALLENLRPTKETR
nr:TetR/AcrR family transcriptional regulator [Herbihabitans rhizosphaerae]